MVFGKYSYFLSLRVFDPPPSSEGGFDAYHTMNSSINGNLKMKFMWVLKISSGDDMKIEKLAILLIEKGVV